VPDAASLLVVDFDHAPGAQEDVAGMRGIEGDCATSRRPTRTPKSFTRIRSRPAGHAVIAGACSVVLKACFDGSMLLPGCVEPSADGKSLVPRPDYSPTVGDEIDKLAFNIAMARNWAGIHYRSDCVAGLRLGEDVAISILQDLACTCTEDFPGFSFKRFSGTEVHITPGGELIESGMNL